MGRKWPIIISSDSVNRQQLQHQKGHSLDPLGIKFTWIKSDPTFEGLKQIINEPQERVFIGEKDPSVFHHSIIDAFVTSKRNEDFFLKNIGELFLNSGLNCVIGPRGAGKSTFLDAVAFSLGDKNVLDPERSNYIGAFFRKHDGSILTSAVKSSRSEESEMLSPQSAEESGFLFDYYYQKQIGHLADPNNEEKLSQFLFDKIFRSRINTETLFDELSKRLDEYSSQLSINKEKVLAYEKEILREVEIAKKIRERKNRFQFLSKESIRHLLEERSKIIKLEERIKRIKHRVNNLEEQPLLIDDDLVDTEFFQDMRLSNIDPDGTIIPKGWKSLELHANTFLNDIGDSRIELENKIDQLIKDFKKLEPSLEFSDKHDKIWKRIQDESVKHSLTITIGEVGKLDSLQRDIVVLEEQLKSIEEKKKEKQTLLEGRKKLIDDYNRYLLSVKAELDKNFKQLLEGDGAILGNTISIEIAAMLPLEDYLEVIASKAEHETDDDSKPQFPPKKALLELFKTLGPEEIITSIRDGKFVQWKSPGLGEKSLTYFNNIKNKDEVAMELEELLPELAAHLLWRPDSSKEFKRLRNCSIGERGTALLSIILVTGNEPLIIDQPEDDLDHFYLYKTLNSIIREVKKRRQLIFATHDANIVVNSDAELILITGTDDGQFGKTTPSSIENQNNREKIMDILEGGRSAFEKREQKYGEMASL